MPTASSPAHRFTIRRAAIEDAALLKDIASRTFYDTFVGTAAEEDFVVALEDWFNVPRLEARIADLQNEVYIAGDDGGRAAGYAIFRRDVPPFPTSHPEGYELVNLYLESFAHGSGLAQELMRLYFGRAKEQGLSFLWLGVWEHNYRAQRFYAKMGFAYTGYDHPFPIHNTPQTDQWWSRREYE